MNNYHIFYISSSDVPRNLLLEGGCLLTNWPTTVTKAEVLENTLAKSLVVRLTFHELSCNFDNTGGCKALLPHASHLHSPDFIPLSLAETKS